MTGHRLGTRVLLLAGLLVSAGSLIACGHPSEPPNVLLILVDTLRADRLGCFGNPDCWTPHLDRLAREGLSFARATSTSSWTLPAAASLLTGFLPSAHGATRFDFGLSERTPFAPEIFAGAGYETAAFVSSNLVGSPYGFGRGFSRFDESNARGHAYVSSPGLTKLARAWLWGWGGRTRRSPFFLLVHYFDPHWVYVPHAAWMPRPIRKDPTTGEPTDLARYEGEIRLTDRAIGSLLETLGELEVRRSTIVVLVADHGEAFGEHGHHGHTDNLYQELVHVPLVVSTGQLETNAIEKRPVSTVHLLPSLLDLCGLGERAGRMQGRAILAEARPLPSEPIFSEVSFVPYAGAGAAKPSENAPAPREPHLAKSVRLDDWKLVHNELTGAWELYDLGSDPGEQENLASRYPRTLERLRRLLEEEVRRCRALAEETAGPRHVEVSNELREKLRVLGYVD